MYSTALFSFDRKFRYYLIRQWDSRKPMLMFIGLNPSTANETENDPTIRRIIGFAKSWGYGGIYMTNLFSYVSTDPNALKTSGEDIGINNEHLLRCSKKCEKVVFSWGCFKQHKQRMKYVINMFPESYCIDMSKEGYPKHPLYLNGKLKLKEFNNKFLLT